MGIESVASASQLFPFKFPSSEELAEYLLSNSPKGENDDLRTGAKAAIGKPARVNLILIEILF